MRKTKKILIGIGLIFLTTILLFILFLANTSSQYKKLGQGELNDSFICDTIPFSYSKTNHIVIGVKLNGSTKKSLFILDSGASNSLFRKQSTRHNFENNGFTVSLNAHKKLSINRMKKVESLKIGNTIIKQINAQEMETPFDGLDSICGIIGTGLMKHFDWSIDFQEQQIIISKYINRKALPANSISIPLDKNPFSYHLSASVTFNNGKQKNNLLIDLGNSATLSLEENLLLKDSLDLKHKGFQTIRNQKQNKKKTINSSPKLYLLDSLTFEKSSFIIKNIPIHTSAKSLSLLGLGFLNKYKIILSWDTNELILIPQSESQIFIKKTYGFSTSYNISSGTIEIISILEDSPASNAALKPGAKIFSINNINLNSISYDNFKDEIRLNDSIQLGIITNGSDLTYLLKKESLFN